MSAQLHPCLCRNRDARWPQCNSNTAHTSPDDPRPLCGEGSGAMQADMKLYVTGYISSFQRGERSEDIRGASSSFDSVCYC